MLVLIMASGAGPAVGAPYSTIDGMGVLWTGDDGEYGIDIRRALIELNTGGIAALNVDAESPRIEYKFHDGELMIDAKGFVQFRSFFFFFSLDDNRRPPQQSRTELETSVQQLKYSVKGVYRRLKM